MTWILTKTADPVGAQWTGTPNFPLTEGTPSTQSVPVYANGQNITLGWVSGTVGGVPAAQAPSYMQWVHGANPSISFSGHTDAQDITNMILSATVNGIPYNSPAGTVTVTSGEPSWTTVPTITFTQGVEATANGVGSLLPHVTNFNASLHEFTTASTLPSGVTLDAATGYVYDGQGALDAGKTAVVTIADKATTADTDFARRIQVPGLIRYFNFSSAADLGGGYGANYGNLTQGGHPAPVIDTSIKASGTGSMRFDCNAAPSGSMWWTNLSADLSRLYGAGDTVYFQFRYRVSTSVAEDFSAKIFLFGTGDTPGVWQSSCTDLEIEMNSQIWQQRWLAAYNACPESCGANSVFPFFPQGNPGGQKYLIPNTWHTIQCGVTIGPLETHNGHDWFAGSNVKMWIQDGTGPEVLLYDWTGGVTAGSTPSDLPPCWGLCGGHTAGSGQKYGKLWLLPYNQDLDTSRSGQIWYDDLIIATSKIPAVLA